MANHSTALVQELWNYCNILRDDVETDRFLILETSLRWRNRGTSGV